MYKEIYKRLICHSVSKKVFDRISSFGSTAGL